MLGITSPTITPFMFGEGSRNMVGAKAKELGVTKVIIVTDKVIASIGILDSVYASLQAANIPYVLYDGVVPDPTDTCVDEGGKLALEEGVDGVIAVGGGSSLDTGKCINVLLNNPMPIRQHFVPNIPQPVNHPLIAIPTTAGSGAECTAGSIITDTVNNVKVPVANCGVSYIFVDPEVYAGMPLMPSVYCAFDALTHAMDLMTSIYCDEFTTVLTEKAVRLIAENLPKLAEDTKDLKVRANLALAATLSGQCLNTDFNSTHYSHSVGHSLGAKLHMQHGYACGVAVAPILERLAEISPVATRLFCDCMGFEIDPSLSNAKYGKQAKEAMKKFMKSVGMKNPKELGYELDQLLEAVPMMLTDIITVFKWPAQLDYEDFVDMITEAYDQDYLIAEEACE